MTQEALKLALEALETGGWNKTTAAITAIKEALAQPEQEPVAIMREMLEIQGRHGNWNYDSYMHGLYNGMEYMVALTEKREPQFRDAPDEWLTKYEVKRDNFNSTEPLTEATPPQRTWVGLTDEEVDECYYWKDRQWTTDELVRHVEAKLKQKNGYAEEKNT